MAKRTRMSRSLPSRSASFEITRINRFFCYLPWDSSARTVGHRRRRSFVAAVSKTKPWTAGQRTDRDARVYAAFMHMVDRQIGQIVALLKKLNLDDNTLFVLSGDNGGQDYFKTEVRPHGFFAPNLKPTLWSTFSARGRVHYTKAD